MNVLEALEIAGAVGAAAASAGLAWRAARDLWRGAFDAAHGAATTRRRLQAQRMRIFALAGLSAVGMAAVAAFQRGFAGGFAGGGVLKLSGGMLVFGIFAWASARNSRRIARQKGSKREHVRERMRAHRRQQRQQQQRGRRGRKQTGEPRRQRSEQRRETRRQRQQQDVRRALRTLGLREGATPEEIKHAWRRQALLHHPDRHMSEGEAQRAQHAEAFRHAQRAYDMLRRPFRY